MRVDGKVAVNALAWPPVKAKARDDTQQALSTKVGIPTDKAEVFIASSVEGGGGMRRGGGGEPRACMLFPLRGAASVITSRARNQSADCQKKGLEAPIPSQRFDEGTFSSYCHIIVALYWSPSLGFQPIIRLF